MQVHDLQPKNKNKKKKRVGRGGKRGTYSGSGDKGQRSRAGATTPSYTKELIKKFPKLRGWKNKKIKPDADVVSVGELSDKFSDGDEVTKQTLKEKELVARKSKRFKILGDGEIDKKLTIKNIPVSKSAKEKIEKAGGEIKDN